MLLYLRIELSSTIMFINSENWNAVNVWYLWHLDHITVEIYILCIVFT